MPRLTRSVAEMILAEIIALARQLGDRVREVHVGKWRKVAASCFEVRGKTLGIIGYGHIGSQVSVLAEALGMRVVFFDIIPKLQLGNSQSCDSLEQLLQVADFVTGCRVRSPCAATWRCGSVSDSRTSRTTCRRRRRRSG